MADISRRSSPRKAAKPRKPADHPSYSVMITAAITSLSERAGSSRQAILKYIIAHYNVGIQISKINDRIKSALKAGVNTGALKQSKGTGATGSFRLGDKNPAVKKAKKKFDDEKVASKKPKATATKPKKTVKEPKSSAAKPKNSAKSPAKKANKPKTAKSPAKKTNKPKTAPSTAKKTTGKPKKSVKSATKEAGKPKKTAKSPAKSAAKVKRAA